MQSVESEPEQVLWTYRLEPLALDFLPNNVPTILANRVGINSKNDRLYRRCIDQYLVVAVMP